MTKRKKLAREIIVQALVDALKPLNYAHAFYEGGAAAFNQIDEWSDIDLYLVVDDEKVDEAFIIVEKALKSISAIKLKYKVPQLPWPGIFQAFYKLEDASEYLIIDFVVLKLSCPEKFLEPEIHGNVVFYFNKSDKVSVSQLDKDALIQKIHERLGRLHVRFDLFNSFVQKEINRGNWLEAIDYYYGLTLASLVEALRIKYNPVHYDFKMRYIHYEFPSKTIKKLEQLYYVKNEKDLEEKYLHAIKWFRKIILEIDRKEMEMLVRTS